MKIQRKYFKWFTRIAIAACLAFASLAAVSTSPSDAVAQDTDKITMDFVGFGFNPDFYAIIQGSKLSGNCLSVP